MDLPPAIAVTVTVIIVLYRYYTCSLNERIQSGKRGSNITLATMDQKTALKRMLKIWRGGTVAAEPNLEFEWMEGLKVPLSRIIRIVFGHTRTVMDTCKDLTDAFKGAWKPGGWRSMQTVLGSLSTRVREEVVDPTGMGRWVATRVKGSNGKDVWFITAYRVCQKKWRSTGSLTVAAQQGRVLNEERPDNEEIVPRDIMLQDLKKEIHRSKNSGASTVLMMDANESVDSERMVNFRLQTGMLDLMEEREWEEPIPPTYKRGTMVIDHIYATADIADAVKARGFVNSDAVPTTDHVSQYADLSDREIFGRKGKEPAKSKGRKLPSDNPLRVESYTKYLENQLSTHKVEERLDRLVEDVESNGEKLDQIATHRRREPKEEEIEKATRMESLP
jgi:hypothetical protein